MKKLKNWLSIWIFNHLIKEVIFVKILIKENCSHHLWRLNLQIGVQTTSKSSKVWVFFGENSTLPVIVTIQLNEEQCMKLLKILIKHKKAIGWTISNIKGISPFICMHCILLEDNYKSMVEMQMRLNSNMKEMAKKWNSQMARCSYNLSYLR